MNKFSLTADRHSNILIHSYGEGGVVVVNSPLYIVPLYLEIFWNGTPC